MGKMKQIREDILQDIDVINTKKLKTLNECNHIWQYQEEEEDTNITAHNYCTKCDAVDFNDDESDWDLIIKEL